MTLESRPIEQEHAGSGFGDWPDRERTQCASGDDIAALGERAHVALSKLAHDKAQNDYEEARWLPVALRSSAHVQVGHPSFLAYLHVLFGYSPRQAKERLRVAEALEGLPALALALRDGILNWSAVREITRVATAEREHEWLEVARGKTAREVELMISGHERGDGPLDPKKPRAVRHVLRFEVNADTMATFREAMAKLRREAGGHLEDDASLLAMARQILGGPSEPGRSSYQVVVTRCPDCRAVEQLGAGERFILDQAAVAMVECDAQTVPAGSGEGGSGRGSQLGTEKGPSCGAGRSNWTPAPSTMAGLDERRKRATARRTAPPPVP